MRRRDMTIFYEQEKGQNIVFLELGVGYNTPAIIKYPFWRMVSGSKNSIYVCINKGESGIVPRGNRRNNQYV